jgi:hypothetical protein
MWSSQNFWLVVSPERFSCQLEQRPMAHWVRDWVGILVGNFLWHPTYGSKLGTINPDTEWYVYNKDFDPNNRSHIQAWLELQPNHLNDVEWEFALWRLQVLLQTETGKQDPWNVMAGWKAQYGLFWWIEVREP